MRIVLTLVLSVHALHLHDPSGTFHSGGAAGSSSAGSSSLMSENAQLNSESKALHEAVQRIMHDLEFTDHSRFNEIAEEMRGGEEDTDPNVKVQSPIVSEDTRYIVAFPGKTGKTLKDDLLYSGHVVITAQDVFTTPIGEWKEFWGFGPNTVQKPEEYMAKLKNGASYNGKVTDDTKVFRKAAFDGYMICRKKVKCDKDCRGKLDNEKGGKELKTKKYSFPPPPPKVLAKPEYFRQCDEDFDKSKSWVDTGNSDQTCMNCATYPLSIGIKIIERTGNLKTFIPMLTENFDGEQDDGRCKCFVNGVAENTKCGACMLQESAYGQADCKDELKDYKEMLEKLATQEEKKIKMKEYLKEQVRKAMLSPPSSKTTLPTSDKEFQDMDKKEFQA